MINFNVILEGLIMEGRAGERDRDRDSRRDRGKERGQKTERILKNIQNSNNYKQTMLVPTLKTHKNYKV